MPDPRFYEALGPVAVETLAAGFVVLGDGAATVVDAAPFGEGVASGLSYVEGRWAAPEGGLHGVVIGHEQAAQALLDSGARAVIVAAAPRAAFARMVAGLFRQRSWNEVGETPRVEAGARVSPTAVLGAGCEIGAGTVVGPYAVIGPGVAIGRGGQVGPHASIQCALLGDEVFIGAGAVVGDRGFGVAGDSGGLIDVPHLGRVILQDRVSVGAGSTIDRGMMADTVVGEESKIDNLCQIAHNVRIGRRVVIAAFGGISGSCVIEDGVRMGGRVGLADHLVIGAGSSLAAGALVMHDVPQGETWGGFPAQPVRAWLRENAWLRRAVRKRDGRD